MMSSKRPILFLVSALVAVGSTAGANAKDPVNIVLRLDDARLLSASAIKSLAAQGRSGAVVVVNAEGNVIVSERMDGGSYINLDVAQAKAWTAAGAGASTRDIAAGFKGGDMSLLAIKGLMPMAGGVPVLVDGKVIGAVGVSGGAPDEDQAAADAAEKAFRDRLAAAR